jgi:K+-transporting ATPase A subunit
MKKNMGTADRAIRAGLALAVAALYFTGRLSGTTGIVLLVIAIVFLLTSLVGTCPGYLPFGISTCGRRQSATSGGGSTG